MSVSICTDTAIDCTRTRGEKKVVPGPAHHPVQIDYAAENRSVIRSQNASPHSHWFVPARRHPEDSFDHFTRRAVTRVKWSAVYIVASFPFFSVPFYSRSKTYREYSADSLQALPTTTTDPVHHNPRMPPVNDCFRQIHRPSFHHPHVLVTTAIQRDSAGPGSWWVEGYTWSIISGLYQCRISRNKINPDRYFFLSKFVGPKCTRIRV